MTAICITDLESAINYWRHKKPSPDGFTLPGETRALAQAYAMMVFNGTFRPMSRLFRPKP